MKIESWRQLNIAKGIKMATTAASLHACFPYNPIASHMFIFEGVRNAGSMQILTQHNKSMKGDKRERYKSIPF